MTQDKTTVNYRIDADNNLVVNKETRLSGTWSLTDNYELSLKLDTTKDSNSGDKIILGGTVKDTSKNSLDFEISRHDDKELQKTYTVTLTGTWQADPYNKLIFKVKKKNGRHDILTFNNEWIIGKHQRIVYKYEKADLISKKKETREIVFKGYWNITPDGRFYYEFADDSRSRLKLNVGAATFEKNRIKYKITIGKGSKEKDVTIGGQWKLTKDLGLTFDVDYGENEVKPISFGGAWEISKDTGLSIKLNDGLEVKIDHKWFDGDGEAFIKYHQRLNGNRVDWGVGVRW